MTEPFATDSDGRIYVTPAYFETHYGRSHRTVRQWITLGQARSLIHDQALYVHLGDARRLSDNVPWQPRGT